MVKVLLSAGIFKVKGSFHKGDVVEVFGMKGLLGKGEVKCSSDELQLIIESREKDRLEIPIPIDRGYSS